MWVVYLAYLLIGLLGLSLRKHHSLVPVASATLGSSVLFFLVTNFAFWPGHDLYPHTFAGLVQSYIAGLPFYGWTPLGDAVFAVVLFGGFALAEKRYPVLQPAAA